jgi:hypothetical protein
MKGVGWFIGLVMPVQEIFSALATLAGPVQKFVFLTVHYFSYFVPIAQQAGQAAVRGRLSLNVCLWW